MDKLTLELGTKLTNALAVMTKTPHIREYLEKNDPQALKQAFDAIGESMELVVAAERKRLRPDNDVDETKPQVIRVTMEMTPSEAFPADKEFRGEMSHNVWDLVRNIEMHIRWMQLEVCKDPSPHLKEHQQHELEKAIELVKSMKIEVVNQE